MSLGTTTLALDGVVHLLLNYGTDQAATTKYTTLCYLLPLTSSLVRLHLFAYPASLEQRAQLTCMACTAGVLSI